MPIFITKQSVAVMRDGAKVIPEIDRPFSFTDDEVAEIEISAPGILVPVSVKDAEEVIAAARAEMSSASPPQPPRPTRAAQAGGKKPADDADDL